MTLERAASYSAGSLKTLEVNLCLLDSNDAESLRPIADLPCLETLKLSKFKVLDGPEIVWWPNGGIATSLHSLALDS